MNIAFQIMELISIIAKLVLMIYSGWKFFSGDIKNNATLWYGILFVATLKY